MATRGNSKECILKVYTNKNHVRIKHPVKILMGGVNESRPPCIKPCIQTRRSRAASSEPAAAIIAPATTPPPFEPAAAAVFTVPPPVHDLPAASL